MQRISTSGFCLLLMLACSHEVFAAGNCARWEAQRDRVYQQMRRPHGAAQGNRLRARLRELGARIAHECR